MGLMYAKLPHTGRYAWRPYFNVLHGNTRFATPNTQNQNGGPGQVWGNNGYRLNSTVAIEVRIDPTPNDTNRSRVVLRTEGFAYHANPQGTGGQAYLIQISFADMPRIPNLANWRILAVVALNSNQQDRNVANALVSGTFNNVRLNGAVPTILNVQSDIDNRIARDFGFVVNSNPSGAWFLQSCKRR